MVVCSAYLPFEPEDPPPTREFEELVRYCEEKKLYLIIECDSNCHYKDWGSTNCNDRGEALLEFLNSTNLEILNQGNDSTFCNSRILEVIDITLGSVGLMESIKGWEVSSESSLSDHRYMMFNLEGSVPERLFRETRGTNLSSTT